jgi:hypothetical protein
MKAANIAQITKVATINSGINGGQRLVLQVFQIANWEAGAGPPSDDTLIFDT